MFNFIKVKQLNVIKLLHYHEIQCVSKFANVFKDKNKMSCSKKRINTSSRSCNKNMKRKAINKYLFVNANFISEWIEFP